MKKYNLKRFLASLLAVLMLASVTGVSPAVFADWGSNVSLTAAKATDKRLELNGDKEIRIPYKDNGDIDFDALYPLIFETCVDKSKSALQSYDKSKIDIEQQQKACHKLEGDFTCDPIKEDQTYTIKFTYHYGSLLWDKTEKSCKITFLGREASVINFKENPTVKILYNEDLSIKLDELYAAIWANVVADTTPAGLSPANVSIKYYASPKTGSVTDEDKNWVPLNGGKAPVLGVPITYPAISEGTWKLRFEFAGNADYKGFSKDVEVTFTGRDPAFELKDNVEGMEIGLVFKSATEYDYDATAAAIREALVTKLGTIDLSDVKVQYKSAGQAVDLNYKPSTLVGTAFGEGKFTIVLTWGGDKGTAQYKPFSEEVTVKLVDNRIPSVVALVDVANITYNMDANVMIEEIIKNAIDSANSTLPADYKASDFTVRYDDDGTWAPIEGEYKTILGQTVTIHSHLNAGDGQKILVTYNGSKDYKPSAAVEGTLNVAKADVKVNMKLLTSVLAGQKVNKDVLKVTLDPNDPELDLYIVFVGFNTYKEKTIYVKLTEDQEKVIDTISDAQKGFPLYYKEEQTIRGKLNEGMTVDEFITYVDELMKNDTIKSALEKNGIDAEMLQNIVTALKSINKVTGDLRIAIGSPKHAGLYQAFAVAVNKNYNTGVGTGTVIVAMNAAGMKLEPNTELKKQTITVSEAEKYKKGEKAVATLTCDGDASDIDQSCIHYRFTGINGGKFYSSHDFPTAPGKYIVTVSVRGGDYYALPTTFTFTVKAD